MSWWLFGKKNQNQWVQGSMTLRGDTEVDELAIRCQHRLPEEEFEVEILSHSSVSVSALINGRLERCEDHTFPTSHSASFRYRKR